VDDQPATLEDSGAPRFRILPAFTANAASSGISAPAFVIVGDDAGETTRIFAMPLSAK
jgi:hypothetical protein